MYSRLAASFRLGAVIRTSSQPASIILIDCAMLPSVSMVSIVVIDCRRMGLLPPIPTVPTITSRVALRLYSYSDVQ